MAKDKVKRTNNQIAWVWLKWFMITFVVIAAMVVLTCWSFYALNIGDWHPALRFMLLLVWMLLSAFLAGFDLCDE